MERLLANKGIASLLHKIDWENGELLERYVYTEKMVVKNIFIYVYEETYTQNHFIEIDEYEYEDEDGDDDVNEENNVESSESFAKVHLPMQVTGEGISILSYDNAYAHEFVIYNREVLNDIEPGLFPMMVYRIILDLVDIIHNSPDNISLYENMKRCSKGSNNSKDITSDHMRRHVQLTVLERIQRAHQLIKEKTKK